MSTTDVPVTYPPGTVIGGRYRIDDVLGIGGFGAVYRCTQLNMDQTVAVKVLKMEHLSSDEHVKRFVREARAASKLRHPNTISMFDFGKHEDGALYLAMEYLEGETLADRLDGGSTLSATELVHIIAQICHSLSEAHEANLVHRDLKPENIMLMSVAGDPNYVKVLDFGIAKVDDEFSAHEKKLTEIGMIMGTPTYMSPEQAYGKVLDARSDIYALGVLMYEGLTGRVPFEGDKPMEVLVKHINDPPAPPSSIDPDLVIPLALEKVVLRCLEKKPEDRPQTTLELADAMHKAMTIPDDALMKGRREAAAEADPSAGDTVHVPELAEQAAARGLAPASRSSGSRIAQSAAPRGPAALWIGLGAFSVVAIVAVAVALLVGPQEPKQGATPPTMPIAVKPKAEPPATLTRAAGAKTAQVPAAAPLLPEGKAKPTGAVAPAKATAQPSGDPASNGAAKPAPAVPAVAAKAKPTRSTARTKRPRKKASAAKAAKTGSRAPAKDVPTAVGNRDDFRLPDD